MNTLLYCLLPATFGGSASAPPPTPRPAVVGDPSLSRYVSPKGSMRYTENAGQWDPRAKFHAAVGGADIWLTSTGIVYGYHGPVAKIDRKALRGSMRPGMKEESVPAPSPTDRVAVDFVGASGKGVPHGIAPLPGVFRFYNGKNSGQLAHAYGAAEITDLYPGIDLVSYVDKDTAYPRYDLIVHPGADPSKIRMRYMGAKNVHVSAQGEVRYATAFGEVSERRQMAYQKGPKGVDYRFFPRQVMEKDGTVGFDVAGYHPDRTLVIDPLVWSTFIGEGAKVQTLVEAVRVDPNGFTYVAGQTTNGSFLPNQTFASGIYDAFVAKFTPSGALVFGVDYGGSNVDTAGGVGFDASGNLYASGDTQSNNLPVTDGSTNTNGTWSGYVAKFDHSTGNLDYGKYLFYNDASNDYYQTYTPAIVVTPGGTAYVAGNGATHVSIDGDGGYNLIVYEIPTGGGAPTATFDMGSHPEITASGTDFVDAGAAAIAIDPSGNLFVSGYVDNTVNLASGYQTVNYGSIPQVDSFSNGFLIKISGDLTTVLGQTYLGGQNNTYCTGVAVDATGAPYVCGGVGDYYLPSTPPFPTTAGAYQTTQPDEATFLSKFSPDLTTLTASTFLGYAGNEEILAEGIAMNGGVSPVIAGFAGPNLPTTSNAFEQVQTFGGGFISQFSADLTQLTYSTFLGPPPGRGSVQFYAGDVDASGNYYVGGYTNATNYPTTPGVFEPTTNIVPGDGGGEAGVVTVLNPTAVLSILTFRGPSPAIAGGIGLSFQAQVELPNAGGGQVTLSSADGTHVQVNGSASASITAPAGDGSENFTISAPVDVAADTPVVLTATFPGAASTTITVTVKPFVQTVVMSNAAVRGGNPIGAKAYVWEAPTTTQVLTVSSSSPDATGPATVHVSPGNTVSSAIVFQTNPVTAPESVTATAALQGGASSASAMFDIDPVVFKSAVFKPNPVTAGDDAAENPTVTVTLTGPVAIQTEFTLTSGNPSIAGNILVTVPAGSSTGTGTVTTNNFVASGETSVAYTTTFTATGAAAFAGRLYIYPDVLKSIVFTPATVNAGSNATATVTVTGATVAAQTFNLTFYYNTNALSTVPVTIPAGQTSTTVTVPTTYTVGASSTVYELSGTYNGGSAHGYVTVVPNRITNLTLSCANSGSGNAFSELDTVQASVSLAFAAPNGATIPVSSTLNGIVAPFSVTVGAGQSTGSATFNPSFTALAAPRAMTITANFGTKASEAVTVNPEIVSLTLTPSTILGGESTTATITLFDNAPAGSTVMASVSSPAATLAPGTNPIAITGAGLTYSFTVNSPTRTTPTTVTVQITGLGYTRTAKLTINPT